MGDWTYINGTITIKNNGRLKANRYLSHLKNYTELCEKVNSGEAEWSDFVEISGLDNPRLYRLFINRLFIPHCEGEMLHQEFIKSHHHNIENEFKHESVVMEEKNGGRIHVFNNLPAKLPFQPIYPLSYWDEKFCFYQNTSADGSTLTFTWMASIEEDISPNVIEAWIKDICDYFRVVSGVLCASWPHGEKKVYSFGYNSNNFYIDEDFVSQI